MPLQNRVTPQGEIIADAALGSFMGNRGILHDDRKQLGNARWKHANWIVCVLDFKDRHRVVMTPGCYTELFFLDEAVALAAGHRPCGECRRDAYRTFMEFWVEACADLSPPKAKDVDRVLHHARIDPATRRQRRYDRTLADLPDGTFICMENDDAPHLVWNDRLLPYAPAGYGPAKARPSRLNVTVLTPEPLVRILHGGYRPTVHTSASN